MEHLLAWMSVCHDSWHTLRCPMWPLALGSDCLTLSSCCPALPQCALQTGTTAVATAKNTGLAAAKHKHVQTSQTHAH